MQPLRKEIADLDFDLIRTISYTIEHDIFDICDIKHLTLEYLDNSDVEKYAAFPQLKIQKTYKDHKERDCNGPYIMTDTAIQFSTLQGLIYECFTCTYDPYKICIVCSGSIESDDNETYPRTKTEPNPLIGRSLEFIEANYSRVKPIHKLCPTQWMCEICKMVTNDPGMMTKDTSDKYADYDSEYTGVPPVYPMNFICRNCVKKDVFKFGRQEFLECLGYPVGYQLDSVNNNYYRHIRYCKRFFGVDVTGGDKKIASEPWFKKHFYRKPPKREKKGKIKRLQLAAMRPLNSEIDPGPNNSDDSDDYLSD